MQGHAVASQLTHVIITGGVWREVWDRTLYLDEPRPETTWEPRGALLDMATTWHEPDGSVHGPYEGTWRFSLEADELRVCAAGEDRVPSAVDDSEGVVTSFKRVRDAAEIARVSAPDIYASRPERHHPGVGTLRWDDNLNWWKSEDGLISLSVPMSTPLDPLLEKAHLLDTRMEQIKGRVAEELLALHNESWREEEGEESLDGFSARLLLEGVVIYEDMSAEVYFEDGGLFHGHVIVAAIDSDGRVTDAHIAG